MKVALPAALVAGLALSAPALAADPDGRFALRSLATLNCGQIVATIEQSGAEELQALVTQLSIWLGGYLTHANRTTPDVFDVVPFGAERDVLAVVVNRCEQLPPETNFEATVAQVVALLEPLSVPSESPMRSFDGALPMRESMVIRVQERLIEFGHLAGSADGVVGPLTRQALQAFQAERGLDETAVLDLDVFLLLMAD